MNYRDVVDRIRQVVFDHKMLVDFGYGQLSDIKTRAQGDGLDGDVNDADYPYCFLNPQPHVRTETQITYNFNMILMDMAREEEGDDYQNFLAIQSDCIQYIDDIVARLYYHYKDQPEVQFNYSYNPFYERFQDQLAGATANLSIIVPTNINDCISPFVTRLKTVTTPLGEAIDYHETITQNIINRGDAGIPFPFNGQFRVIFEGEITNQQLLPEDPAKVILQWQENLPGGVGQLYTEEIVVDGAIGATNKWYFETPIQTYTQSDTLGIRAIQDFGTAPNPDIAPGGIITGLTKITIVEL